jgi:hypothetical protein
MTEPPRLTRPRRTQRAVDAHATPHPGRRGGAGPVLAWAALILPGACSGDELVPHVGEPCIVAEESEPTFSGFSQREVNIEHGGSSCGSKGVCLVHDFQGRATCPSGQAEEGICSTPDGEPVVVPVPPQLADRPAEQAMVCSCRCDGPDANADYCACPSGMRCVELIVSQGRATDDYAGSYCIY